MSRPVFSFRPNMENPEHQRAWKVLESVPNRQKNAFLVRAILQLDSQEELRQLIRESVREGLNRDEMQRIEAPSREDDIPDQMLSFLEGL